MTGQYTSARGSKCGRKRHKRSLHSQERHDFKSRSNMRVTSLSATWCNALNHCERVCDDDMLLSFYKRQRKCGATNSETGRANAAASALTWPNEKMCSFRGTGKITREFARGASHLNMGRTQSSVLPPPLMTKMRLPHAPQAANPAVLAETAFKNNDVSNQRMM